MNRSTQLDHEQREPTRPADGLHEKRQSVAFWDDAHIGVDSKTKLIQAMVATVANVHDNQVLGDMLHGEENRVWGEAAYTGQSGVIHRCIGEEPFQQKEIIRWGSKCGQTRLDCSKAVNRFAILSSRQV